VLPNIPFQREAAGLGKIMFQVFHSIVEINVMLLEEGLDCSKYEKSSSCCTSYAESRSER
jgi:hypothetical protein